MFRFGEKNIRLHGQAVRAFHRHVVVDARKRNLDIATRKDIERNDAFRLFKAVRKHEQDTIFHEKLLL